MRSATKGIQVLGLACLALAIAVPVFSQTTTGRILGEVHDQTGAALAGATVTVTDVERATKRTAATDVTVDMSLPPGDVKETVIVTDEVPLVNTTSSTLGGTLSNKEINDLPLNGRNYENLLQLRPGVERYPGGGFSTTSANGLRAEDNAYFVEGLFNSEPYSGQAIINGAGIAGDSATILPIDAIQEFNIQENPPAEYGWKPGAVVNVGLKSGTNRLHGSAFAFGRDGAM